jgi:hypothetical protein
VTEFHFDNSADFDPAPSSAGPWLHFYAKVSQDGIPAGSWALRDGSTTTVLDLSQGFVLNWPAARTGWVQALGVPGVAPVKQWNPSRAKFEPRPPGDKWAKGFMVTVAYAPDAQATWEQWGAGIWIGFSEMFADLMTTAPSKLPNLPLLVPQPPIALKFAQGPSLKPMFTVARFVPPPACLASTDAPETPAIAASPSAPPVQLTRPAGWDAAPTPAPAQRATVAHTTAVQPPVWGASAANTSDVVDIDSLDDAIPF